MALGQADVFVGEVLAGHLLQDLDRTTFSYVSEPPPSKLRGGGLSIRLPLSESPFETAGTFLHPFFANLLPEGFRLEALRSRLKVSRDDAFTILLETAADAIGDVSVVPQGEHPKTPPVLLPSDDPAKLDFQDLLSKDIAIRTTIPGVQEKVSDAMVSFPVGGSAGPCILKLNPPKFPRLVNNESFFMSMAKASGLAVAETRLLEDKHGETGLLVKRFDRRSDGTKRHQEDACQLLNIYPGSKYNVSSKDIAGAVQSYTDAPTLQIRRLAQLVAFSYLIGNGDLHAKNVSVYLSDRGLVELTPAYDVLSTLPYPLDQRMAIKMDGRDDNLKRPRFSEFFLRHGLAEALLYKDLDRICDVAPQWIGRLNELGYDEKTTDKLRREIERRREHLAK